MSATANAVATCLPECANRLKTPVDKFHAVLNQIENGSIRVGQSLYPIAEKCVAQHDHVFFEGNRQKFLVYVLEGVASLYKVLPDGRRNITRFAYPGDVLGLQDTGVMQLNAEALTTMKVRCIPLDVINKLIAQEAGFGQGMLAVVSEELRHAHEQIVSLGCKSALEKVATLFLDVNDKTTDSTVLLPMTRSDIADYLGLTIETVSRCITRLKVNGLVKAESRSRFRVVDTDGLAECSGSSPVALRHTLHSTAQQAA